MNAPRTDPRERARVMLLTVLRSAERVLDEQDERAAQEAPRANGRTA